MPEWERSLIIVAQGGTIIFRKISPFWNYNSSKATGVENCGKVLHF